MRLLHGNRLSLFQRQLLQLEHLGCSFSVRFHKIDDIINHQVFVTVGSDIETGRARITKLDRRRKREIRHEDIGLVVIAQQGQRRLIAFLDQRAQGMAGHPAQLDCVLPFHVAPARQRIDHQRRILLRDIVQMVRNGAGYKPRTIRMKHIQKRQRI